MTDCHVHQRARVDYNNPLYKIRQKCYREKKEFGQSKLMLTQRDIIWILNEQHLTPDPDLCIVPLLPSSPITRKNAVCVDTKQKAFLMALWRLSKNESFYIRNITDIIQTRKE